MKRTVRILLAALVLTLTASAPLTTSVFDGPPPDCDPTNPVSCPPKLPALQA